MFYRNFYDCCEHIVLKPPVVYISKENDSFGVVAAFCVCETCYNKIVEETSTTEVICHDCKQIKMMKDTIEWKWFDFHPSQGDEPLRICNECALKEKHLKRVSRDRDDIESYYKECKNL